MVWRSNWIFLGQKPSSSSLFWCYWHLEIDHHPSVCACSRIKKVISEKVRSGRPRLVTGSDALPLLKMPRPVFFKVNRSCSTFGALKSWFNAIPVFLRRVCRFLFGLAGIVGSFVSLFPLKSYFSGLVLHLGCLPYFLVGSSSSCFRGLRILSPGSPMSLPSSDAQTSWHRPGFLLDVGEANRAPVTLRQVEPRCYQRAVRPFALLSTWRVYSCLLVRFRSVRYVLHADVDGGYESVDSCHGHEDLSCLVASESAYVSPSSNRQTHLLHVDFAFPDPPCSP